MNFEVGHDTWSTEKAVTKECPRCHRNKYLGHCEDGCEMCQSCFGKVHGDFEGLPSDTMQQ